MSTSQSFETNIPLHLIVPSRWQSREPVFDPDTLWELAASIKANGLINAIVVFSEDGTGTLVHELVAGERRTRAMLGLAWGKLDPNISPKEAVHHLAEHGLNDVSPATRNLLVAHQCQIRGRIEPATDLQRLHVLAVVDNLDREDLNPVEEARGYQSLIDAYDWSQRELARQMGKSQGYIMQRLQLLGLSAETLRAVNTRVLTPTHARAITGVPVSLQPAITTWAVQAVSNKKSPASTRDVEKRSREIARFVELERWEPEEGTVYRPSERNRLAWLRGAVENADLAHCGEALLKLTRHGWSDTNLLTRRPQSLIRLWDEMSHVLEALGATRKWAEFAASTGRTCEHCVFGKATTSAKSTDQTPYCKRWQDAEVQTCEDFIGTTDPVIIPMERYAQVMLFKEAGAAMGSGDPFWYMTAVPDYVKAYQQAVKLHAEEKAVNAQKKSREHIEPICQYWQWQQTVVSPAELAHFQAHACTKCKFYQPSLLEQNLPPCDLALNPAFHCSWNKEKPRAPEFAVLGSLTGLVVPRCEGFAYRNLPEILGMPIGIQLPNHDQALDWLIGMGKGNRYSGAKGLWGLLTWLDYGRPLPKAQNWDKLRRYIRRSWDVLGGDPVIATLIDAIMSEQIARDTSHNTINLLDPTTREIEKWAVASFDVLQSESHSWVRNRWPSDFPKPWETHALPKE